MPAIFPQILPEELLYSAFARNQAWMRFGSDFGLAEHLFGTATATAIVDLPTRMDVFVQRPPPGPVYIVSYQGSSTHRNNHLPNGTVSKRIDTCVLSGREHLVAGQQYSPGPPRRPPLRAEIRCSNTHPPSGRCDR